MLIYVLLAIVGLVYSYERSDAVPVSRYYKLRNRTLAQGTVFCSSSLMSLLALVFYKMWRQQRFGRERNRSGRSCLEEREY